MNHIENIEKHLAHACEKHPHFADKLYVNDYHSFALCDLNECRDAMKEDKVLYADDILKCEILEAKEAYTDGRKDDAIEEIYDAIAVLLRMAEMMKEDAKCVS